MTDSLLSGYDANGYFCEMMPVASTFDGSAEDFIDMNVEVTVRSVRMLESVA